MLNLSAASYTNVHLFDPRYIQSHFELYTEMLSSRRIGSVARIGIQLRRCSDARKALLLTPSDDPLTHRRTFTIHGWL
jgi:hypothetical protein